MKPCQAANRSASITLENGFKIYHAGDTGLSGDLKFIDEDYKPDLAMLPIGGNCTMDPVDAAYATKEMLKPKCAIPMHYGANPLGKGTPQEYINALGDTPVKVFPITPADKSELRAAVGRDRRPPLAGGAVDVRSR